MSAQSRTTEAPTPLDNNNEDVSQRDLSKEPLNRALDQSEEEFKPSKLSKLTSMVVDELKRNFNIDPTGEEYIVTLCSSLNKGQSFVILADSTDKQRMAGQQLWAKEMIDKEMMDMMMNQNEIITMAKQKLKDEQAREQELLKKNS